MVSKAQLRYLRISPRKVRQVIDLVRGTSVLEALSTLMYTNKRAARPVSKLILSAIESAKQKGLFEEQLYVSKVTADQGPMWKRYRSAPFGRATKILKKTTHVKVELGLIY